MIKRTHLTMARTLASDLEEIEPEALLTFSAMIFKNFSEEKEKDIVEIYRAVWRDINLMELGYEPEK